MYTFDPKDYISTILDYSRNNKLEIREFDNLKIINYARDVQYNNKWDFVTLNCRGLIVDENWNVVARSFPKFFNHNETNNKGINLNDLNNIRIQEKLDGSLGLMFHYNNEWKISTKGSLNSTQAQWATNWYNNNKNLFNNFELDINKTYVFEIINNEHVVHYTEDKLGMYLLTSYINSTGIEIPTDNIDYLLKPKLYSFDEFNTMFSNQNSMSELFEGFVLIYNEDNEVRRIKFKYDLYNLIHKVRYNTTFEYLLELYLKDKGGILYNEIINVDDEDELLNQIGQVNLLDTFYIQMKGKLPDELFNEFETSYNRIINHIEHRLYFLDDCSFGMLNSINNFFDFNSKIGDIYNPDIKYFDLNNNEMFTISRDSPINRKLAWFFKYFRFNEYEQYKSIDNYMYTTLKGNKPTYKFMFEYLCPEWYKDNIFKVK